VLLATILAPVQEVAIDLMTAGPAVEVFDEGVPDLRAIATGDHQVGDRLADVVTEGGEEYGQMPPRLELASTSRRLLAGQQHAITGLERPQGDFGRVTQESAGTSVMMRLAGWQEMRIGGKATKRLPIELLEDLWRRESGFTDLADQLPLRLDEFVRVGCRQTLHERRVAGNLVVFHGLLRRTGLREGLRPVFGFGYPAELLS
jgi:hypothetical protein